MINKYGVIKRITASLNKIRHSASLIPISARKVHHNSNSILSTRLNDIDSGWYRLEKLVEKKGIKLQEMQREQALVRFVIGAIYYIVLLQ